MASLKVISVLFQFGELKAVVYASHARCAIVEPNATMRVLNYADSRIECGSC